MCLLEVFKMILWGTIWHKVWKCVSSTIMVIAWQILASSIIPFFWLLFWFRGFFYVDKTGDNPTPTGIKVANVDVKLFLSALTDSTDFSGLGDGDTFEIFIFFVALVYVWLTVSLFLSTSLLVLLPPALLLVLSCFWIGNVSTTSSLGCCSSSVSLKKHIKWFQILQNYYKVVCTEI